MFWTQDAVSACGAIHQRIPRKDCGFTIYLQDRLVFEMPNPANFETLGRTRENLKLIRAEYDAYNRRFKLLDSGDAAKLQDGKTYLIMDSSSEDLENDSDCTDAASNAVDSVVLKSQ